jgi:hypothetical protein
MAGLGSLVCLGCAASQAVTLASGPRVVVPHSVHDFGEVRAGEIVRHLFLVENPGNQPLTLAPVRNECGCTAEVGSHGTLAAGDRTYIAVSVDTTGLAGSRTRSAVFKTNDPTRPEVELVLRGKVVADVEAKPSTVFFGHVPVGAAVSRSIEVTAAPEVAIESVHGKSEAVVLAVRRLEPPRHGVRISITLRPSERAGRLSTGLLVKTSSPRQPVVEIPIHASIEWGRRRAR